MVNKAVQTKRNPRNKHKVEGAQDYEERMANKAKFHKYKNKQESERKPNSSARLYMDRVRLFWQKLMQR